MLNPNQKAFEHKDELILGEDPVPMILGMALHTTVSKDRFYHLPYSKKGITDSLEFMLNKMTVARASVKLDQIDTRAQDVLLSFYAHSEVPGRPQKGPPAPTPEGEQQQYYSRRFYHSAHGRHLFTNSVPKECLTDEELNCTDIVPFH